MYSFLGGLPNYSDAVTVYRIVDRELHTPLPGPLLTHVCCPDFIILKDKLNYQAFTDTKKLARICFLSSHIIVEKGNQILSN